MTEKMQAPEVDEAEALPMTLIDRLQRCKSRNAARKSIAEYCEGNGLKPAEFRLSVEESLVFSALK